MGQKGSVVVVEMRVLPVVWVRAWTELEWPVSWETAFAVRDRLGWETKPHDGEMFWTELSVGDEGGVISNFHGRVDDVTIPLTTRVVRGQEDEHTAPRAWAAYRAYVEALTGLYGPGRQTADRGIAKTEWVLSNRVTLNVGALPGVLTAEVESPELTALGEYEEYYIEKYGEDAWFNG
ncbi:hypothetical protein D5R93_01125 [Actinomyces lilanjuaniae]|uniref:Uncharacterized protein n=2 Tax=Actinomyces lilanjuaniae TaxID=2321394 RepID=A0ABM6Z1N2_9ACTO|nr:hypothetical protein D5R93_01125 [Actinomyces lilanjuaniae]